MCGTNVLIGRSPQTGRQPILECTSTLSKNPETDPKELMSLLKRDEKDEAEQFNGGIMTVLACRGADTARDR